jgi:hypothetical protein
MCAHKQKFILTIWALNSNGSAIFKIYISSTWCSASILKEISRNFVLSIYIICIEWKFQTHPPDRSYVVILIKQYKTKPSTNKWPFCELWTLMAECSLICRVFPLCWLCIVPLPWFQNLLSVSFPSLKFNSQFLFL